MEDGLFYIEQRAKEMINILIVEDSAIVAMQIQHLLAKLKYNVVGTASTGEEAISKAEKFRIDLVLMDIRLEGKIDGIETAIILRKRFDLPVIYLTAYSDENTFNRAKLTEPFGYIMKPFETREIQTTIEIALYKYAVEKKLKQSEELYRTLVENTQEGIIILDKGRIEFVNNTFALMLGHKAGEITGLDFTQFIDPNELQILDEFFRKLLQNDPSQPECEITLRSKDRINTVIVNLNIKPVFYNEKKVVICTVKNITEDRRIQDVLKRSEEGLRAKLEYLLAPPPDENSEINILELLEIEKLQMMQDAFADSFGIASLMTDVNGNPITQQSNFSNLCKLVRSTPLGRKKCIESDKLLGQKAKAKMKPYVQSCASCGLTDASVPIIVAGHHIANWLFGQVNLNNVTVESLCKFAGEINADGMQLADELKRIPVMDEKKFEKIVNLYWLFAQEISSLAYNNLILRKELFEKKKAEHDLQRSEVKNDAILQAIPDSMFQIKADGSYDCLKLSNIADEYFMYGMKKTTHNVKEDFPPEIAELMIKNVRKAVLTNTFTKFEFSHSSSGQPYHFEARIAVLDKEETLVMIEDITDKKNSEVELIKAKEIAERSDRLKSEFLAQISHEIRTPINAILSFSSLLKEEVEGLLSNGLAESFKIIEKAGRRLIRTIDEILEMSQLQTGNYEINPATINLAKDVLENLLVQFFHFAKENHVDLCFENKLDEGAIINADKFMINQVFSNLLDNAIKYTPEGKIEIVQYKNGNDEICIDVRDTGIGISDEYLPRLFTPFSQEDSGYTRRFEGNGLGLAIVKKYVELNNARIMVDSQKGKGSVFTVIFQ